jgi:phage tail tape-measure protein
VLLTFQDTVLRIGDNVRERPRRLEQEREARSPAMTSVGTGTAAARSVGSE